jgi:hypothetical protein
MRFISLIKQNLFPTQFPIPDPLGALHYNDTLLVRQILRTRAHNYSFFAKESKGKT